MAEHHGAIEVFLPAAGREDALRGGPGVSAAAPGHLPQLRRGQAVVLQNNVPLVILLLVLAVPISLAVVTTELDQLAFRRRWACSVTLLRYLAAVRLFWELALLPRCTTLFLWLAGFTVTIRLWLLATSMSVTFDDDREESSQGFGCSKYQS